MALTSLLLAAAVLAGAQAPVTDPAPSTAGVGAAVPGRPSDHGGSVHPYRLRPGDRVRFWTDASPAPEDATVVASDQATLTVVRQHEEAELLQIAPLARLEVRRGRRHFVRGLLIGLLAGAATYAATGDEWDRGERWERKVGHAAIVAGSGAVLGAVAGTFLFRPSWVPVRVGELQGASLPAAPLRVTIRF